MSEVGSCILRRKWPKTRWCNVNSSDGRSARSPASTSARTSSRRWNAPAGSATETTSSLASSAPIASSSPPASARSRSSSNQRRIAQSERRSQSLEGRLPVMGYAFLCREVQRIERRQTMEGVPKRLLFNTTRLNSSDGQVIRIPSEDPPVELRLDPDGVLAAVRANGGAARVPKQVRRLGDLRPTSLTPDPFGPALDWAYRSYRVIRPKRSATVGDGWPFRKYLYLFNVLVALEWYPSEQQIRRLECAFRRASDFLFDVTDGWMALGQVVFGGPELQAAADIQVMASNRLHPRAWVGGLHPNDGYERDEKFMPLRLGRGLWNDVRKGAIPWEEPEGYRIIVHEWGHYALKLIDEYLETRQVLFPADLRLPYAGGHALVPGSAVTVVTLKVPTTTDSIMATTEGVSELMTEQWPILHTLYPRIPEKRHPRAGPDRLPLALPRFRQIDQADGKPYDAASPQWFPRWDSSL